MKWKYTVGQVAALCLLAGGVGAWAEPPVEESAARPPEFGQMTRQWLESQRQGKQASEKPQPLSGPVQEQIYERYRKSFSHPIPERFESEKVNAGAATR